MMPSEATSVEAWLEGLPEDRRETMRRVLDLVRRAMPEGYDEVTRWGMITWEVPLPVSGKTYNGQPLMYVALGNQKRHMALYLSGVYSLPELEAKLRAAYAEANRPLDLGKSCLRFRRVEDLLPDAVSEAIAQVPPAEFARISRRD